MQNVSKKYLRDVLGVTSVIVPEELLAEPKGHFQVTGDFAAKTAVVSFAPVHLSERELCQKMLMAVGAGTMLLIEFSAANDVDAFSEFFGAYQGKRIWCFGGPSEKFIEAASGRDVLCLPTLAELTDQTDPDLLMAKKREVWAKLQAFQKSHEESQ